MSEFTKGLRQWTDPCRIKAGAQHAELVHSRSKAPDADAQLVDMLGAAGALCDLIGIGPHLVQARTHDSPSHLGPAGIPVEHGRLRGNTLRGRVLSFHRMHLTGVSSLTSNPVIAAFLS